MTGVAQNNFQAGKTEKLSGAFHKVRSTSVADFGAADDVREPRQKQ